MSTQPSQPISVAIYQDERERFPFTEWLMALDGSVQPKVLKRLARVEVGNLGDWKPVGGGVAELRFKFGAGFRVYFGRDGDKVVVLLGGGDKASQSKDIQTAQERWKHYLSAKSPEK